MIVNLEEAHLKGEDFFVLILEDHVRDQGVVDLLLADEVDQTETKIQRRWERRVLMSEERLDVEEEKK